jgi:hypothetical protein
VFDEISTAIKTGLELATFIFVVAALAKFYYVFSATLA